MQRREEVETSEREAADALHRLVIEELVGEEVGGTPGAGWRKVSFRLCSVERDLAGIEVDLILYKSKPP